MQKRQINKAYAHYTEMMMALGSQNIMPKEIFVKMCEMMFLVKGEDNSNQNYNQLKEWQNKGNKTFAQMKHEKNGKSKASRPNKDEEKSTESPQKQINNALDNIIFLKGEIIKHKKDASLVESLKNAIESQRNKILRITNNGKQIKGLFNNQYYINYIAPNN